LRQRTVRRIRLQARHDKVKEPACFRLRAGPGVDAPEEAEDQQHIIRIMTSPDAAIFGTRLE
jgi:hypothetical protein